MTIGHPSWEELVRHLETGEPDLREHTRRCSRCDGIVKSATLLLEGLRNARLPMPPRHLVEATLARVTAEASRRPGFAAKLGSALREIGAALVADSRVPSHALRGAATAVPRMLLYETDRHRIAISIAGGNTPGTTDLLGQVSPKTGASLEPGGRATLSCGTESLEDSLTEFGEFAFRGVARGVHRIAVELGGDVIRVGDIDDGASSEP